MIKLILSPVIAWLVAHASKVTLFALKKKRFDIKQLKRAGGMPSGHAATVTALSLALYFEQGFSNLFIVALIFSIIVIRDATIRPKEARHTPIQVLVGIILGLVISWVVYFI